jgi:hypothetical protein
VLLFCSHVLSSSADDTGHAGTHGGPRRGTRVLGKSGSTMSTAGIASYTSVCGYVFVVLCSTPPEAVTLLRLSDMASRGRVWEFAL